MMLVIPKPDVMALHSARPRKKSEKKQERVGGGLSSLQVFLVLQSHTGMLSGVAVPAAFPGIRFSLSS